MEQASRQLRQIERSESARLAQDPSALTTTDLVAREQRAKDRLDRANELLAQKKLAHGRRERERVLLQKEHEANRLLEAALEYDGTYDGAGTSTRGSPRAGSGTGGRPPRAPPASRSAGTRLLAREDHRRRRPRRLMSPQPSLGLGSTSFSCCRTQTASFGETWHAWNAHNAARSWARALSAPQTMAAYLTVCAA